jgi:4-hydroxy-2-oxoheptanedioate aldolase
MFAPANFQQNGQDHLRHANDNIVDIVQIESRKAVENPEETAKTDGIGKLSWLCQPLQTLPLEISLMKRIDALFIGPNDLAASMGYFAFDHAKIEEIQQATVRVLQAAKDAGKFAGYFGLSAEIGKQGPNYFIHVCANK